MRDYQTKVSRRSFIGGAAALAAASLIPTRASAAGGGKPNSDFGGVQIGAITYSYRSMPSTAEDLLGYLLECGLSNVELMGGPAEQFAKKHTPATGINGPMDGYRALGKMYRAAGVNIHIVKFGDIGDKGMSDEQINYYFRAAKALGAKGITREMSEAAARRLGPMADKHKIMIAFHNHTEITPTSYDGDMLSFGKYLRINLDIGHYVAGTSQSPIPFIEKHHARMLSMHLKDRKKHDGPNMPWGQGDTPIAEVLRLVQKNKWPIYGDIELEYKIPKGSNAVKEVIKCVQFCKKVLT